MALVRTAADEVRIAILFRSLAASKINELVVTTKNLTNYLASLVTSGRGSNVARGSPVGTRWTKLMFLIGINGSNVMQTS